MTLNNKSSFETILEENKNTIYRICNSYAVLPLEPQDLFQEVVFQLWKSFSSFKGNAAISTWIYRITLNVCIRSQQKLRKNKDLIQNFESIRFSSAKDAMIDNEKEKELKILQECILSLNEADHTIILLHLEELSYRQISEITGFTENHIAVKMKRIKNKLLSCITSKLN